MPEYLHPGVYIEEIERGPRPIEGVPTSTAALLGEAERGQLKPRLVTSYKDYKRWYGDVYEANKFLPFASNGFFENGGKRAFICRLVGRNAVAAEIEAGDFFIRASGPGAWGNRVVVKISNSRTLDADGNPIGFHIQAAYWSGTDAIPGFDPFEDFRSGPRPSYVEDFDDLVTDESSPDFYGKRLPYVDLDKGETNQGSDSAALFMLRRKSGAAADSRPPNMGVTALTNGADDPVIDIDYTGAVVAGNLRTEPQGLTALELDPYRDVALVYGPGASAVAARAIVEHCEKLRFRFAVVDCQKSQDAGNLNPRKELNDSDYSAFYYPWIVISDPRTGARKLVPPGGHVLGIFSRTDTERGVFKSPANETVRGVLDLEYDVNDNLQDDLNPKGVNAIRSFPNRGIRVWGARTVTSDALWKYISVRRLFIFLERSVYENLQWVVFENNDDRLWARVVDTIRIFLRGQWRLGALFGRTEAEAFFITCDRTTMGTDDILNGRLICEIGIAPVRPAEFVVFRIFQNTAEAQR